MANLVRRKQVDQLEFSGFFVEIGDVNYYPLSTNPSSFITDSDLTVATGQVYVDLNATSGNLNTSIILSGQASNSYSDGISGALNTRLDSTGNSLTASISSLSGYVISVSGSLTGQISATSGVLNTKLNNTSGDLKSYTNSVSGNLSTQITNNSSATTVNSIVSGNNFNFTGTKVFNSTISTTRINLSGVNASSQIALVSAPGIASFVAGTGTLMSFIETGVGSTSNSLFAVADAAGVPMLELFDDTKLVLGRSAAKAIVVSGVLGYVLMPSLPNETQISSLPVGTLYKSGNYLMIK